MGRALVVGVVMLVPDLARADIMPEGAKYLRMTALVEGKVPASKEIRIGNTWDGPMRVVPGKVTRPIEWHPLGGSLHLRMHDVDGGSWSGCSEPFDGVRAIPATSPADELRFVFKVKIKGDKCEGTLVRTEYLNSRGEVVDPGNLSIADLPLFSERDEPEQERDLLSVKDEARKSSGATREMPAPKELLAEVTPAAIQAQGCGCRATGAGGWWLVLLVAGRRSRLSQGTRRLPRRQA